MTSVQGCTLVNRLLQKAHGGAIYRVPWNRNKSSKCKAFIRLCGVGAGLKLLIMQGYFFNEYNQYYYPDKTVRVINVNHLFNCVFTLSLFSHFSDIFRSFVQFYNLIPNLSIEKNISLPLVLDKQKVDTAKLEALAERLGIKNKLHNFPHELSGGQQQRSAIARSLIYAPALLLADEPTGNLDRKNTDEIISLLHYVNKTYNQTILMVTHDERLALSASRIVELSDGKIVKDEAV